MNPNKSTHLKEQLRKLPNKPGVYIMYDRFRQTLYVGKAKNLKKRVSTYFQASRRINHTQPKIRALIALVDDFDFRCVNSESEALLLESQLIKKYKPRYNTSLKDDKRFLLIQLNLKEALPKFRLTRNKIYKHYRYYGPFPHSSSLRKTLNIMKQKFGILLSDATPKKIGDKEWRLYDDARAELSDLPNVITEEAYKKRIKDACQFLEGKTEETIQDLEGKMKAFAQKQNYEKAGAIRDHIIAIEQTSKRTRKFERNLIGIISESETLECLQKALNLNALPASIECFDISHISGSFCVASMVRFQDGKPDRKNYRRYKIKSFVGNDDFRAIEEVVARRYKRLEKEGKAFPDLIVIDGGLGQVHAALKALMYENINPPNLIGLAKKNETIVFPDGSPSLNLPFRDPALRLLQHLRDEAHYYANNFNAELRSKKIKESILDDFKGFGVERKSEVIRHFGTIEKLKQAGLDEILAVKGIGPKTGLKLLEYLQSLA